MGRRSINTTKSGKYMNPTDQARKEARKAELKKNKKQRQMVRAAVLKGKDPHQILEEMEKIDQMEYNVSQPSPLNEKVLKDKRKKLKDTLDRVLMMYQKDDQEKYFELKKRQTEYEQKRNDLVAFFESVKTAQSVTVDDIPLPQIPQLGPQTNVHANIPLPTAERKPEPTIYSIATALKLQSIGQPVRDPPGCPPGPAPNINEEGEVEDFGSMSRDQEEEAEQLVNDKEVKKPMNALQQKMIALSGQSVDDFIKDLETAQQKKAAALKADSEPDRSHLTAHIELEPLRPPGTNDNLPKLPRVTPSMVPPPLMFTGAGIRLPPGPPPGRPLLPPGPPPGLPPRGLPLALRIPLPSAPNLVRMAGPPLISAPTAPRPAAPTQPNVLSAAPQLINRSDSTKQGATISAKPQIRNLSADVTKFVPSALRVKREEKKSKPVLSLVRELKQKELMTLKTQSGGQHKDDAYKQFMQEMEDLM